MIFQALPANLLTIRPDSAGDAHRESHRQSGAVHDGGAEDPDCWGSWVDMELMGI